MEFRVVRGFKDQDEWSLDIERSFLGSGMTSLG